MKYAMKLLSTLSLAALASAQLDKPALTSNLDYLLEGNTANLPTTSHSIAIWSQGWIPKDCKDLGEGEDLDATDFEIYQVSYDDCSDPWLVCRHKEAPNDISAIAETFGRVPVKIRDWVRQILVLPGGNSAFAVNGNVAFFGTTDENVDVVIHESAHCLDGFAAFGEVINTSENFLAAYDADTHVPDDYARSSQAENVAQNTVVAVYDSNVPGGFPGIQPNYTAIENQYSYIKKIGGDALVPGGTCDRHLENSETVPMVEAAANGTVSSRLFRKALQGKPDSSFKGAYGNVVKEFVPFESGRETF
ncbi:hypothetical protein ASPCAL07126 [Aspergillus calidoustus]|uniref:Conidiation-specific protein 13 n=1 Tax=Aspergillus calidoustus TaxID=454130 RepID=A0A0U5G5Z4_ASPCI|nr:hypothetical protein ASPCAL07126 [Aspergillus calidoustus]